VKKDQITNSTIMDYASLFLSPHLIENELAKVIPPTRVKSESQLECNKCDYKTTIYTYMYRHKRTKHSDIKQKCTKCDYAHPYPTKVKSHYKQVHLGIARAKKDMCRKNTCKFFSTKNCTDLKHYLFSCHLCDFSTKRNYNLKYHVQGVHEGLSSYSCDQCDYLSTGNLKRHIRVVHEGEAFSCDQCEVVTTQKSTLKEHKLKKHPIGGEHVNVMRCLNEGCTFQTKYKRTLKYHIESKHEGIVRYRCQNMNCSFATNQQKRLKEHTRGHNKEKQY
jgi:hypothetical protein